MMLHFGNLFTLHTHYTYLSTLLGNENFFIVGGSIRDILLGIMKNPTDIDITMPGTPDNIRSNMQYDKKEISRFRTEKFGTMTIIPQKNKTINYELTPLRTEGNYEDFRHPGKIKRSDDILLDASRRDFTINCIYYHTTNKKGNYNDKINLNKNNPLLIKNQIDFIKKLKQEKYIYIINANVLILQNHNTISRLFKKGILQEEYLTQILPLIKRYITSNTVKINNNTPLSFIIDPFQGIQDLITKKIRTVGNPDKRFTEDALRIIRGVRFPIMLNQRIKDSNSQGFDFEKKTRESMGENAILVKHLAKERLYIEITKVFKSKNPFGYISLLNELKLIKILFPSLEKTKGNYQPTRYHTFDTFNHILLTLHALQTLINEKNIEKEIEDTYLLKLAILYHDVGKPEQYKYITEQKNKNPENIDMSNYIHHTESGLILAKKDLQKLGFSKKEIETVLRYIRRHHRPHEILESKEEKRNKKLRKIISQVGKEKVLYLMDMVIADRLGQFNPLQNPAIKEIYFLKELTKKIYSDEGRFTMKKLNINGNDIIEKLKLTSGPQIGKILHQCFERVLSDIKNRNRKGILLQYAKNLLNK